MTIHSWQEYPVLAHIEHAQQRKQLEARRRHRQVRYLLFRMKTAVDKGEAPNSVEDLPPHFEEFWLLEEPEYMLEPRTGTDKLERVPIPPKLRGAKVSQLGGYASFATKWDVDEDLLVYLRWSSVWQEWNATLMRVVPVLGE